MNNAMKIVLAAVLTVIVGSVGFIGGFAVARTPSAVPALDTPADSDRLNARISEVNELLQDEALNPPSETSATAGAIQGLVESGGDKYATYFDQKHLDYFNEDMAGEFGGIGVVLGERDGTAYVVEVYDSTPASKAGIKSGDIFMQVDAVRREKWTTDEVVKRVRGKAGTNVKLTLLRPAKASDSSSMPPAPGKEYTVNVKRAVITLPNIESELKGDVGYIRLGQFNAKATDDIAAAVKALEKKGAKAFVLDLRDNPGGALQEAVGVSSLFVPRGVVVRVDERGKDPVEYRTSAAQITKAPLTVLINENSASASEIVGGALQDYDRAKLVGVKSFGKGSVQNIETLSFGGAVKFTTAHYLTPRNRAIDGIGLTPDVVVKMDAEKQADEKTDIQLKRALAIAGAAAR